MHDDHANGRQPFRQPRQPMQAERAGLRLERALAACSGQLLAEKPVPVARALRALVQGGDLLRAALFLNEEGTSGDLCLSLAAQAAGGNSQVGQGGLPLPLQPGEARGYLELGLGRWAQKLFKGVALSGPSHEFPPAERAWLELCGPCSCAILPLRRHGRWAGLLRVDAPDHRHAWTREELSLLKVAAGLFGARLEREYSGDALGAGSGGAQVPGLGDPALLSFLDSMPVLVAALDSQGRIAFWNRECQRVTGYSAHEVVGDRDMARRLFPDLAPARGRLGKPGHSQPAASQSLGHQDVRVTCKNGGVRTIAWSDLSRTLPLPGSSTAGGGLRWKDWRMGVDISERSRVEQAIVQAKQEWERTFDSVPDCILILDEVLHARRMNMTLADRLGLHPREVVGKTLSEVVGTDGDAALRILALASCSACTSEELSIPRWGGHFLVTASPYVDARDAHAGTIVVAHDISRWKQLEDQLEQSRKLEALGTLAGGIAHDFNNILGVIMGYAEMVLLSVQANGQGEGASPQEHRVQEILRAGTRAKELIAQILAFSRQGEGRLIPLTLGPLVKEVLQHLMVTMPHGVHVRRNLARETGTVMGDPSLLHQVVLNLCTNAVQALGEGGGTLEVGLDEVVLGEDRPAELAELPPGPCVRLTVRDTGPGIPPEILGRIFDPFFTTKRPGEGTGMGLAVVHGIMRRLGGGIAVESRPGGGTSMSVYLPRAEAPGEAGAENGRAAPAGRGHVLLVDDEAALLEVWAETLTGLGYRVTAARSAEEALAAFMEGPEGFDLLLTDQVMPRISGTELAGLLLGLRPDLPVVLCTGNSGGAVLEGARKLGVAEVLDKPVSRLRMAEALGRVLERKGGQKNGGRQPR